jgi:hypothetical protein
MNDKIGVNSVFGAVSERVSDIPYNELPHDIDQHRSEFVEKIADEIVSLVREDHYDACALRWIESLVGNELYKRERSHLSNEKEAQRQKALEERKANAEPRKPRSKTRTLVAALDMMRDASDILEEIQDDLQCTFDERSEKWQQSERGEAMSESIEHIGQALSQLNDAIGEAEFA